MSNLWLVLHLLITVASGAAVVGLIGTRLTLEERVLIAIAAGFVLGTAASFLLGLTTFSIYAGPALLGVLAFFGGRAFDVDVVAHWRLSWDAATARWKQRTPWGFIAVAVGFVVSFLLLFWFAMQDNHGTLQSYYSVVWADWAHHLTRATSLSVADNIRRLEDPLFAGTPLHYPFLTDFLPAEWMTLGIGPGAAFVVQGAFLTIVIALSVVCLALRLGMRLLGATLAVVILFIGGGLGFVRIASDSCLVQQQANVAQASPEFTSAARHTYGCTLRDLASSPAKLSQSLKGIPAVAINQPQPYDGLGVNDANKTALYNYQWFTPLFAIWLNQPATLFGFITALTILIVVAASYQSEGRQWTGFALGGLLLGLMPWYQIHVMFALLVALPLYALWRRRKEWLVFFGIAALVAAPRLLVLAHDPHGLQQFGNVFPTILPGWLYDPTNTTQPGPVSFDTVSHSFLSIVTLPFNPRWWGFWIVNVGVALPLCVIVSLAAAVRHFPGDVGDKARRVLSWLPTELVYLVPPFLAVFFITNIVVYQSWPYDNEKVFIYWYLAAALIIGATCESLMRRWWRGILACAIIATTTATGVLATLRLLPWTPSVNVGSEIVVLYWAFVISLLTFIVKRVVDGEKQRIVVILLCIVMVVVGGLDATGHLPSTAQTYGGGPYTFVTAEDRALAAAVASRTASDSIFVTPTNPDNPILILGGRTTVMGYDGWLWSYGTDFGTRKTDVPAILHGCADVSGGCPVTSLLAKYVVSYVEIDTNQATLNGADPTWWAQSGYPVVASDSHIFVYDVRKVPHSGQP